MTGMSLRAICAADDMPDRDTVWRWLRDPVRTTFHGQYARARDTQADTLAEEALDAARNATAETAQAVRVHVDAVKWFAGKVAPRKYGDKLQHTGADGEGPIQVTWQPPGE